ncbi:MAG: permease-like cell division protein FtsX [Cyclobacteriaceae bacterium]|jgi:cell division transport system permease protein|nr:permease-like cell division protein FtsX [Cyclobacteriaceae bacterium]HQQ83621.1 permease-like cell division protein FtsX [Cyclobacteriaceae bacterium]
MAGDFRMKKKQLGSYPFVSVVLSITLALFVIGMFGLLVIYSQELGRVVRENVRIQVYLKSNLDDKQVTALEKQLVNAEFTLKQSPNPVTFVSRDEAAKQFIKDTGEDFKKFLGENPLRDAFLVSLDPAYHDKSKLAAIKTQLEKVPGVFQVYYVESLIESINRNVATIGLVLLGLAAVFLVVVVLLINNTLRLALFSQRFLIRSMQLVGATRGFIQWPFILRAMLHGALGGLIACGMLWAVVQVGHQKIQELQLIENQTRTLILLGSLLVMGIFVAVVSTWRAVYRYMRLSLDELY